MARTLPAWLWSQRVKLDFEVQNALSSEPPRSFAFTLTPKLGVDGVRHVLGERLRAGATTIDTGDVAAEIERIEALLRAQVTLLFVEPPFLALERAWHGLDRLVRHVPARVDAVACSEDELRAEPQRDQRGTSRRGPLTRATQARALSPAVSRVDPRRRRLIPSRS